MRKHNHLVLSGRDMEEEEQKKELFFAIKFQKWDKVVEIFREHPEIQTTMINKKSRDTALHVAITYDAPDHIVVQLINEISKSRNAMEILSAKNDREDTPLHCAASRGSPLFCHPIISFEKSLVGARNKEGETPLFVAALNGRKETFRYLHGVCKTIENSSSYWRRGNGDTILHCTIQKKYFDLSFQIIHLCEGIAGSVNEEGKTPLDILVSSPSSFRSGTHLGRWKKLCYHLIHVDKLKFDRGAEVIVDVEHSETHQIHTHVRFPSIPGSVRKIKERHVWAAQILEELVKQDYWYASRQDVMEKQEMRSKNDEEIMTSNEKTYTALLTAAKYGLIEVVKKILELKPIAIYDHTNDKKNIVLVAAEEGQYGVFKEIMKHPNWKMLRKAVDDHGNNALHLAAKPKPEFTPWGGSSTFLEMQWDVNWFEYVRKNSPAYLSSQHNRDGRTPGKMFADGHKELIRKSNQWVKEASGNYIVAAVLIAGATFSTCYQIPGGYNGQDGTPIVFSHPMFRIFSVAAFVSFCMSITSLAAFLAIHSCRNDQARHYRRSLPEKLCLGLSAFCLSIISMLISFCAAHSFELDRSKYNTIALYAIFFLAVFCFYSATQIPLHWALYKSSFAYLMHPRPIYLEEEDYVRAIYLEEEEDM